MAHSLSVALALEITALVFAAGLLVYAQKSEGIGRVLARAVSYFAMAVSLLAILGTGFRAVRNPEAEMVKEKKCTMMDQMKRGEGAGPEISPSPPNHGTHH